MFIPNAYFGLRVLSFPLAPKDHRVQHGPGPGLRHRDCGRFLRRLRLCIPRTTHPLSPEHVDPVVSSHEKPIKHWSGEGPGRQCLAGERRVRKRVVFQLGKCFTTPSHTHPLMHAKIGALRTCFVHVYMPSWKPWLTAWVCTRPRVPLLLLNVCSGPSCKGTMPAFSPSARSTHCSPSVPSPEHSS